MAVRCAAALSNPGSFNPDQEQKTPVPELDEAGRAAHRQFMEYVRDLILGEREPSQFEDDVRALLGEWLPSDFLKTGTSRVMALG